MKNTITKYYLGAWQNLYHVNWPIRFLLEIFVLIILISLIIKIIRLMGKKFKLNILFVKAWFWIVTEIVYLVGRNNEWAIAFDNKMCDWENDTIKGNRKIECPRVLKTGIFLGILIAYFLAVLVDLPVSRYLSKYYLSELEEVKFSFQQLERMLSKGYEQYPPLFVKVEQVEIENTEETAMAEEILTTPEEKETIYVQLNERGKGGSNIRSEADLNDDYNIIGGVNGMSEILYQGKWTYDGERYWIFIYVPSTNIEGWLSGNLVDSTQLDEIIDESIIQ